MLVNLLGVRSIVRHQWQRLLTLYWKPCLLCLALLHCTLQHGVLFGMVGRLMCKASRALAPAASTKLPRGAILGSAGCRQRRLAVASPPPPISSTNGSALGLHSRGSGTSALACHPLIDCQETLPL